MNKKEYDVKYMKDHYKRVPLDVSPELYARIKAASENSGESVNGYIKESIKRRISSGK